MHPSRRAVHRFKVSPEAVAYSKLPSPGLSISTVDAYIKTIKGGGTVTLSSQTLKLSLVAPLFLTQAATDLRWLAGWSTPPLVTLNDGTNSATFRPLVVGTGETYDVNLIPNAAFNDTTGIGVSGGSVASIAGGESGNCLEVTQSGGSSSVVYEALTGGNTTQYALYKSSVYIKNGSLSAQLVKDQLYGPQVMVSGTTGAAWAQISGYRTTSTVTDQIQMLGTTFIGTVLYDTWAFAKVIKPSTTGFTFGTLTAGSLNPNAVSFTITVTQN